MQEAGTENQFTVNSRNALIRAYVDTFFLVTDKHEWVLPGMVYLLRCGSFCSCCLLAASVFVTQRKIELTKESHSVFYSVNFL
jgi:hypothetical protein